MSTQRLLRRTLGGLGLVVLLGACGHAAADLITGPGTSAETTIAVDTRERPTTTTTTLAVTAPGTTVAPAAPAPVVTSRPPSDSPRSSGETNQTTVPSGNQSSGSTYTVTCADGSKYSVPHYVTPTELAQLCPWHYVPGPTTPTTPTTTTIPLPHLSGAWFTVDGKAFGGLNGDASCKESTFGWRATYDNGVSYSGSFVLPANVASRWRYEPNPSWNGSLTVVWDGCGNGDATWGYS